MLAPPGTTLILARPPAGDRNSSRGLVRGHPDLSSSLTGRMRWGAPGPRSEGDGAGQVWEVAVALRAQQGPRGSCTAAQPFRCREAGPGSARGHQTHLGMQTGCGGGQPAPTRTMCARFPSAGCSRDFQAAGGERRQGQGYPVGAGKPLRGEGPGGGAGQRWAQESGEQVRVPLPSSYFKRRDGKKRQGFGLQHRVRGAGGGWRLGKAGGAAGLDPEVQTLRRQTLGSTGFPATSAFQANKVVSAPSPGVCKHNTHLPAALPRDSFRL